MINDYLAEFRQTLRALSRRPGYAALIIVIIAVVIGATTAIFAVVDSVLLRALPYPEAARLVLIWDTHAELDIPEMNLSMAKVRNLRERSRSFDRIGVALSGTSLTLSRRGQPRRLVATLASPELLRLTGVRPALGRTFADDENRVGSARRVVLLSHGLWRREFGSDESILGDAITLDGVSYTVIGVMPPDFVDFPYPEQDTDVWVPAAMASEIFGVDVLNRRNARVFVVLARLRAGASRDAALTELGSLDASLASAYPQAEDGWSMKLEPLRESFVGDLQAPLIGLAAGSVMLLLIGCANVISLLLVRATRRQAEIATRRALGASTGQLLRQGLLEVLTLMLGGAVLGMMSAAVGLQALAARVPLDWPRYIHIEARPAIFVAAMVMTSAASLVAVVLTVVPGVRSDARTLLASGARAVDHSGGRLRRGLVVTEVAVAIMLLVGAGLVARSVARLHAADVGFSPERLVTVRIDVPADAYSGERLAVLARELERQVETVVGVSDGYIWSRQVPGQATWYTALRPEDRPELDDDELPVVRFHHVGPGALEGIGLRFISGRGIHAEDSADGDGAIVLSESAARALWPDGDDPLGKVVRRRSRDRRLTVVGITEDAKLSGRQGLGTEDNLDAYFSFLQDPQTEIVVLARADGDAAEAVDRVRDAVQRTVPSVPTFDADTMEARLAEQEAVPRFTALIAAGFAGTALFLASIGLYGVLAYSVSLNARDIGLKVALGAAPTRVLREVMFEGVRLAILGAVIGIAAALATTRWLTTLLFEVSPSDPATFVGAVLLLVLVATSASFIPARRAVRIDPQRALRAD